MTAAEIEGALKNIRDAKAVNKAFAATVNRAYFSAVQMFRDGGYSESAAHTAALDALNRAASG